MADNRAVAKRLTYLQKVNRDMKRLVKIITEDDFVQFKNKQGEVCVELTRDCALKGMHYYHISHENTELVSKDEKSIGVRVTGHKGTKLGAGIGFCMIKHGSKRPYHDAAATAETRALKRMVEELSGLPVLNRIIQHYFPDLFKQEDDKRRGPDENGLKIMGGIRALLALHVLSPGVSEKLEDRLVEAKGNRGQLQALYTNIKDQVMRLIKLAKLKG